MSTPTPTAESKLDAILAALTAKAKAEENKISTWLKTNWAHFVTWAALAAPFILKHL